MNFLRSSLLISLVSLLVLTGYASGLFCDCHDGHRHEMTEHDESIPANGDDCKCICHQAVPNLSIPSSQPEAPVCTVQAAVRHADEFPPDAVPRGVDHPPQLA